MLLLALIALDIADLTSSYEAAAYSLPQQAPVPVPAIEQIDPSEYVLGPGDVLWLCAEGGLPSGFFPSAGTSVLYLTVAPDGEVIIPLMGGVPAGGLTLDQATLEICSRVHSRFRGVTASAGLAGVRSFRVAVTGEVVTPGIVTVHGTDHLWDVIAAACGSAPGASLSSVLVISSGGDSSRIDLAGFLASGDPAGNPMLAPGDRVFLDRASDFVEVQGALFLKGPFSLQHDTGGWSEGARGVLEFLRGETAGECILRAGGLTPWAMADSIYIERPLAGGGVEIVRAPWPSSDVPMEPGDRLICPGSPASVSVTGFVHAPGPYPWVAGRDALYYIGQAGGFEQEARQSGTKVALPSGEEVDARDAGPLPAGAVISVPRKLLMWWQDYLTIATGVASVVIAWKSVF